MPDLGGPAFGELAVRLKFITSKQLEDAIETQQDLRLAGKPVPLLGEVLVQGGHLTKCQVLEIMKYQATEASRSPIDGYILLSRIGKGAMGEIYKAVQISMDRIVALKILSSKYAENERVRKRFVLEARTVARLNHPNIVQGFDVGVKNDVYYMAMEYIDGPTVGDLLRRGGAMEEKRAIGIALQVAQALEHAYKHQIIHRDIKPDNIMLTRESAVKLCDLGLAKDDTRGGGAEATRHGTTMGTPHYISPEQARGDEAVDTRSDIYSLGATLYHMAIGTPPFPGDSAIGVIAKHLTEAVVSPRQRNPLVSAGLEWIILKMLQKDPKDRYQTPSELVQDLERVLRGESALGMVVASAQRDVVLPKLRRNRVRRSVVLRRLRRR